MGPLEADQLEWMGRGLPLRCTNNLHDDVSLRGLCSAADVMVIPSRQDNLPNTGVEAHACESAVVQTRSLLVAVNT